MNEMDYCYVTIWQLFAAGVLRVIPEAERGPVSAKRIRLLVLTIPKFQNRIPRSAASRINPNAMSSSGAVDTERQMAPSAAKQQKKSAFSCHNCRSRKVSHSAKVILFRRNRHRRLTN